MAPITVAVESLTTPADAITAERAAEPEQLKRRLVSGPSKKSWSRIRVILMG